MTVVKLLIMLTMVMVGYYDDADGDNADDDDEE